MFTRRGLFGGLFGFAAVPTLQHQHVFRKCPFWLMASGTFEEPSFYPPSNMIGVQMCSCGALRMEPEIAEKYAGKSNLREGL